jgi:putative phage-type endonuclease
LTAQFAETPKRGLVGQLTDYKTREAWLAARSEFIGASEVAALFGLLPKAWGSMYTVWAEKIGLAPPVEFTGEWLEWGQLLEEPIARRYEMVTGRTLWNGGGPYCVAQHPRLPILRCTPDRFVIGAPDRQTDHPGILQIKNAAWFKEEDWYDGPPPYIQMQVQAEMACTGAEWASTAVLIGGNKFKHVDVERNQGVIDEIEEQVEHFWHTYVLTRTPPEIDGSEATSRMLRRLHPMDDGSTVYLTEEDLAVVQSWEAAKAEITVSNRAQKVHKALKDESDNRLRAAIGSATFGALPDGRILSLRHTTKDAEIKAVEEKIYRRLKFESTTPKGKQKK